tara:strand:- start:354 stop:512 length:159 start_codon:yes stop_codon:yes gene_type:complete
VNNNAVLIQIKIKKIIEMINKASFFNPKYIINTPENNSTVIAGITIYDIRFI